MDNSQYPSNSINGTVKLHAYPSPATFKFHPSQSQPNPTTMHSLYLHTPRSPVTPNTPNFANLPSSFSENHYPIPAGSHQPPLLGPMPQPGAPYSMPQNSAVAEREAPARVVGSQIPPNILPSDLGRSAVTTTTHLNRHLRSDADKRPYKCTLCDGGFYSSEYLNRHSQTCCGKPIGAGASHLSPPQAHVRKNSMAKQKPHDGMPPSATGRKRKSSADAKRPVRKRVTRACDQCNQLRTKCDGQQPCAQCTGLGIECQYNREQKKRGKAASKELAQKDSAGKATDTAPRKKAKKSDAAAIRRLPPLLPSFPSAARSTPMESIPGTSVLPHACEPRSVYPEHMPANAMYGNQFVPVYDGTQPDESGDASGDVTGSEQSFSTNAGWLSYHHGSGSVALSNSAHLQMAHAGQPQSAPFQGIGKCGEEPASMEGSGSNWQSVIPSSQGPYFPCSFPAATNFSDV